MTEQFNQFMTQITLARTEIKNLRQQISGLKHEHLKEIRNIKSTLGGLRCASCAETATTLVQVSLNEPSTSSIEEVNPFRPIGVIESSFQNKRAVPRQPSVLSNARGAVVINTGVFNNPVHALEGLEEFSHIWIIFHFHNTESNNILAKVAPPRLGGERRGVFSTRSPHRPCPIGLSLVKIQSVEGNRINFLGVDMVNGTPVLDIKPYIPQYDCATSFSNPLSTLNRPPTEGISDNPEAVGNMMINDGGLDGSSNPSVTNSISIDTAPSRPFVGIPSPNSNILTPISPSPESPPTEDVLRTRTPHRRPDTERGAPDGQERFTPPQLAHLSTVNYGIRIAPWISNPPTQPYDVRFSDDALTRLNELISDQNRAQAFKSNLESLLSDDPRSHYVKTRYPDHEYSCLLEDVAISCVFNASSSVCTIVALRNAEEMQSN